MTGRTHGGPDAHGALPHDFSTCAHPLGPCPGAWQAVQAADARHYEARAALTADLAAHGFEPLPGVAAFVCARMPRRWRNAAPALRRHGVAVRDCSSFGLPGHWRLNALSAASRASLWQALAAVEARA